MAYRATKFVSALSAGLVVGAPIATIPLGTATAAEECLAKPRDVTPRGQHWYYIVDRTSKRHCWYLHQETGTSSHTSISRRAHRAAIVAAHKSEPAMTRATADAYAEFGVLPDRDEKTLQISQQTLVASDYPKVAGQDEPATVSGTNAQSPVAARWPEPAGMGSAAVEPPPPSSFVVAAIAPEVTPDAGTADLSRAVAPAVPMSAETATGTSASLEPLILATIGAIALTGFAGSSVYMLAQMRRRPRSHAGLRLEPRWPPAQLVDHTRLPAWLDPAATASARDPDRAHDAEL